MKYIYYALLLSGLLILLIRRKHLDRSLLLFIPFYLFDIVTELASDLWHAYFLYHINQTIGCGLLCTYYYMLLRKARYGKWIWAGFGIYILFFAGYFLYYPNRFFRFDPIDFVVEGVFITIFSLYYLIDLYRSEEQPRISQFAHFWITAVNLLFYSGASFFMGFAYTLNTHDRTLYTQLSYIVYFLNLILYSIYIKAFLCPLPAKRSN